MSTASSHKAAGKQRRGGARTHRRAPPVPDAGGGSPSEASKDLKELPLADVEKQLDCSPDGLTAAEAKKRLTQYGPNEIAEKTSNPLLALLAYFWGPIPWMIEVAVILSPRLRIGRTSSSSCCCWWPMPASGSPRSIRRAGDRRAEGAAGDQGAGLARRNWITRRHASWCGDVIRMRMGDIVPADARLLEGDQWRRISPR